MVFFNYSTMQLAAKIVYCGPGLSGKTTNLEWVFGHTAPKIRGEMVTLATDTDRTVFFDLLPLELGNLAGFQARLQLYTVPGQVFYNSTRKLVLRGVDGVVFVADSQQDMHHANLESLRNLQENLDELDIDYNEIPLVLQYNKRDLEHIMSIGDMNRFYNLRQCPFFEGIATDGTGVFPTLKTISKLTLTAIKRRLVQRKATEPAAAPAAPPKAASTPPPPAPPPIVEPQAPRPVAVAKTSPPPPKPPPIPRDTKPPKTGQTKPAPTPVKPESHSHDGRLRKKLKLGLNQNTFYRAGHVNVSLVIEDDNQKPVAIFRNIRLNIEDPKELQRILLELKVLIKPKT